MPPLGYATVLFISILYISENTDTYIEPLQENHYCLAYCCSTHDGDLIPGTLHCAKIPDCKPLSHKCDI